MVKRMFDLVEERDEPEDEISRLKAENRKLREKLEQLRVGEKINMLVAMYIRPQSEEQIG